MTVLAVTYTFPAASVAQAETHLSALALASRAEPGCLAYEVFRASDDSRTFLIVERYDDQAAFETHLASAHFLEHGMNGLRVLMERREAATYVPFA